MSRTDKSLLSVCVFTAVIAAFMVITALSYVNRRSDHRTNITNCRTISVPGTRDAADRDADLIEFARAAAEARMNDGEPRVAGHYGRIADRAQSRQDRTALRAALPCSERYPSPSLFPF